jgi:Flp pilus assembly protein TadG
MGQHPERQARRCGAVTVETAAVIGLFLLFLFSIFEYGRFVMLENVIVNAAREGCRYAIVHSTDATVVSDVQTLCTNAVGNQQSQFPDLTIQIYPTTAGPSSANSTTTINNLQPDDSITVRITGTFSTMFPTLLFMPVSFQMRSSAIMTCEGN